MQRIVDTKHETNRKYYEQLAQWRKVFAWTPVTIPIDDIQEKIVWLEYVETRAYYQKGAKIDRWTVEYREIKND